MASRQARRIARQSSTASRTSASTRVRAAASSSSRSGIGLAVDLDMHHRFGPRPLAGLGRDAQKVAVEVAPHRQHGMGQQVDGDLAAIELVGDRIDQERHVVVDDLHDGVAAFEAVVGGGGIEHPDLGDAGQAAAGEGEQGDRGGGALVGRGRRQILVGDAAEEAAGEMGRFLAAAGVQGGGADGIQPVNTRRQCDGHDAVFLPAGGRQTSPATVSDPAPGQSARRIGHPGGFRRFPPVSAIGCARLHSH